MFCPNDYLQTIYDTPIIVGPLIADYTPPPANIIKHRYNVHSDKNTDGAAIPAIIHVFLQPILMSLQSDFRVDVSQI